METRLSAKPKLTLTETREFLAHVSKHPRLVEAVGEFTLDDKEVVRFIAAKAKTLYLIASHSNLGQLEKVAEALFFSAFTSSMPPQSPAVVMAFDQDNRNLAEERARTKMRSRR
jgi:hypothetical protein